MNEIIGYLKKHGEQSDVEISEAIGTPLAKVRHHISELANKREIMTCLSIKYKNGKKIQGTLCRVSGYIPPAAPGRKSKAQLKL